MKDVKVYAQNLRSYNIGLDQGRWITLGIEEQETYMASDNEIIVEEDIEITMDN